jgi:hypothetical protein
MSSCTSGSVSPAGREEGSAGQASQATTQQLFSLHHRHPSQLSALSASITCLRGGALLVSLSGAALEVPPAPGRPVAQGEYRLQAALRPRLLLLSGVRWQTQRPAGCQNCDLHFCRVAQAGGSLGSQSKLELKEKRKWTLEQQREQGPAALIQASGEFLAVIKT